MITRKSFLAYAVGMLTAPLLQKESVMEGNKAVVCDNGSTKCPLGHATCREIDMPLAVGNDNYQYPDCTQIREYHVYCCDQCGILFSKVKKAD